jgi:hypothetical protein
MKTLYCFSDVLFLTITTSNEINYVLGLAVKRPFVTENKVIIKRTAIKGVVRVKLGTCKAVFSVTDVKGGDNLIKRFNPLFNGSSVKFIRFLSQDFTSSSSGFPYVNQLKVDKGRWTDQQLIGLGLPNLERALVGVSIEILSHYHTVARRATTRS